MAIKEKIIGDVAVLELKGKLWGGEECKAIHDKVKSLITDDIRKVVIGLSKVKWMNSQGLGVLMACHTSLTAVGGILRIAGATEKVNSLFMITKIITIFENFKTVDRAVASFMED